MKAKLYIMLLLGLQFLLPQYASASNTTPDSFLNPAVQKIEQTLSVLGDPQANSFIVSDIGIDADILADLDIDDDSDSDGSFSARKKIAFGAAAFFNPDNRSYPICNNLITTHCKAYSFQLPTCHFISLRVFRI